MYINIISIVKKNCPVSCDYTSCLQWLLKYRIAQNFPQENLNKVQWSVKTLPSSKKKSLTWICALKLSDLVYTKSVWFSFLWKRQNWKFAWLPAVKIECYTVTKLLSVEAEYWSDLRRVTDFVENVGVLWWRSRVKTMGW